MIYDNDFKDEEDFSNFSSSTSPTANFINSTSPPDPWEDADWEGWDEEEDWGDMEETINVPKWFIRTIQSSVIIIGLVIVFILLKSLV